MAQQKFIHYIISLSTPFPDLAWVIVFLHCSAEQSRLCVVNFTRPTLQPVYQVIDSLLTAIQPVLSHENTQTSVKLSLVQF